MMLAQGVALAAALDAEKADGVGLVEVQGDGAAGDFPQYAVLRRGTGDAEVNVLLGGTEGGRTGRRGGGARRVHGRSAVGVLQIGDGGLGGRCVEQSQVRRIHGGRLSGQVGLLLLAVGPIGCWLYRR